MNRTNCLLMVLASVFLSMSASAQGVKSTLFAEADAAFVEARQGQLHLLSPGNYAEASKRYQEANKDFENGGNLERIHADLAEARALLEEAKTVASVVQVRFEALLNARDNALSAQAEKHAPDSWADASKDFDDAMRYVERGDMNRAKREATRAESEYRNAELTAIKRRLLGPARLELERADEARADRYARKTFEKASLSLLRAEQAIDMDRYDTATAGKLASQAEYEARYATYIAGVTQWVRDDYRNVETLIANFEGNLDSIAQVTGTSVRFDKGMDDATTFIIGSLERQLAELSAARETLAAARLRVTELESRLGVVSESREDLARRQQAFRRASQHFAPGEAQVIRDGEGLVIRLAGLSFPSGSAGIEPHNFQLLAKVQAVLEDFPGSRFIVEGHTDARGSEENNLALSDQRAAAVRQYLLSNLRGERPDIQAVGYGETRPVANNETEAGRAQNRRIDIMIQPEWHRVRLEGL